MTLRLTKVDELARPDHPHLEEGDQCYFFGEYTPREGWSFSRTNDLISNFKKPMARKGQPDWQYKRRAILRVADIFKDLLPGKWLARMTFVPIPPSKAKGDPEHDDRVLRMLQELRNLVKGLNLDVRELLLQAQSTAAAHVSGYRPTRQELIDNYRIDEGAARPAPKGIALFDDVLTNGTHFKAAQAVLQTRYPGIDVVGVFIARRVIVG